MDEKEKNDFTKRLIIFSLSVIKLPKNRDRDLSNKIIFGQLIRCATSIGANVVETKGAASRKDFINYYQTAYKSAKETKYWLILLKETSCEQASIETLLREAEEIAKIIGASLLTLKGK